MNDTVDTAVSLLLVDDDRILRGRLAKAFDGRGLRVFQAADGESALRLARTHSPELVLLDLRMPGPGGLSLIPAFLAVDARTNIVVLTGYGSIATALEAVRLGATHYLTKPVDTAEVLRAFARAEGHSYLDGDVGDAATPTLARVEWEHIQRVLVDCEGNISRAAERLGMHRRSLQRKLAKHPVPR